MTGEIAKYFLVFFSSMIKFIAGPLAGLATGMNIYETIIGTVLGMMASVFLFSFFGKFLREKVLKKFSLTRKLFCTKNRKVILIKKKYGLLGVSFLTPLLLTPIGGALLAGTLKTTKTKLFLYMFISATFWAIIMTGVVFFFRDSFS